MSLATGYSGSVGLPLAQSAGFWFPDQASDVAAGHDFTFFLILVVCAIFFFIITGASAWFVLKYRKRPGHKEEATATHNTKLEIAWSVIPTILLMVFFGVSTYWYLHMVNPPKGEELVEIEVVGERSWVWSFKHPSKDEPKGVTLGELHVVVKQPVRLTMTSDNVIHSFFVPAFRVKQDVVPGRYNRLWFKPMQVGRYRVYCTEYCGDGHSAMVSWVNVYASEAERDAAIRQAADTSNVPLDVLGERLYGKCMACHSNNGEDKVGPTFKGLWGKQETLEGGVTVNVDDAYLIESIRKPNAKLVKGRSGMPELYKDLTDREVQALVEYIKSLK